VNAAWWIIEVCGCGVGRRRQKVTAVQAMHQRAVSVGQSLLK